MSNLDHLFSANQQWASERSAADKDFFTTLAKGQKPPYLWIGCGDSRVPPTQLLGLEPGDLFVHRNIANLVPSSDLNSLAVVQYAVQNLQIEHLIICGHHGCGGVGAVLDEARLGGIDYWLQPVRDLYYQHKSTFEGISEQGKQVNLLSELNSLQQGFNLSQTPLIQDHWKAGHQLEIHSWVYDLPTGLLEDLNLGISDAQGAAGAFASAKKALEEKWGVQLAG